MTTKTYEQVRMELRQIASESPDYVYTDDHGVCVYYEPDGKPSCIVGHWLWRYLGLDLTGFTEVFDLRPSMANRNSVRHWSGRALDFSSDTMLLLTTTQKLQDQGATWRTAVEEAVRVVEGGRA